MQQETLVFLHIIKELKLALNGENLIQILCRSNDFAIIIALDIWKNRKESVVRSKTQAVTIRKAIEKLSMELKGEDYSGSRWFLLYEMKIHKLVDESLIPTPKQDDFFDELYKNRITFYLSISKKLY